MEQVDAVVVGAGAGGGIVAKELAVAGLRIMLLDRAEVNETPGRAAAALGHVIVACPIPIDYVHLPERYRG